MGQRTSLPCCMESRQLGEQSGAETKEIRNQDVNIPEQIVRHVQCFLINASEREINLGCCEIGRQSIDTDAFHDAGAWIWSKAGASALYHAGKR
jgi:hypothetical protein